MIGDGVVPQHLDQTAVGQRAAHMKVGQPGDAQALPREVHTRFDVVADHGQRQVWCCLAIVLAQLPLFDLAAVTEAVVQASMVVQLKRVAGRAVARQVGGRGHEAGAELASVPLAALTAWQLLFERFAIVPGDRQPRGSLLVLGGAGGVGSVLTQLARQLTGLTVIATASRGDSAQWCRAMGAHHVIDHTLPLPAQVAALNVAPVCHIAALSHTAQHVAELVELIAPHGKLAVIDEHDVFDAAPLKGKSVSLHWEMVFTRPLYATDDMQEQQRILTRVAALLDEGVLRHTLRQRLSPMDAATVLRAHALLQRGGQPGKIVVSGG